MNRRRGRRTLPRVFSVEAPGLAGAFVTAGCGVPVWAGGTATTAPGVTVTVGLGGFASAKIFQLVDSGVNHPRQGIEELARLGHQRRQKKDPEEQKDDDRAETGRSELVRRWSPFVQEIHHRFQHQRDDHRPGRAATGPDRPSSGTK